MNKIRDLRSLCSKCELCGGTIGPIIFVEQEYDRGVFTGRIRQAISHLECEGCGNKAVIDDSFDGPWMRDTRCIVEREVLDGK